jgi:hypothetical protein
LIYPHIIGKRNQAELMKKVITKEISFEEGKNKLKQLNKKGINALCEYCKENQVR